MNPAGASPVPDERLDEEARRQDAADLDDEHDGVAHLVARVELAERVDDRAPHDGRIEERAGLPRARGELGSTRAAPATDAGAAGGADARRDKRRAGRRVLGDDLVRLMAMLLTPWRAAARRTARARAPG